MNHISFSSLKSYYPFWENRSHTAWTLFCLKGLVDENWGEHEIHYFLKLSFTPKAESKWVTEVAYVKYVCVWWWVHLPHLCFRGHKIGSWKKRDLLGAKTQRRIVSQVGLQPHPLLTHLRLLLCLLLPLHPHLPPPGINSR